MANKGNKSVFNGTPLKKFASKVQKALNDTFGSPTTFLANNCGDDIVFIESNRNATLKKVVISEVPKNDEDSYIWYMDKWDEPATEVLQSFGLQNKSKAVDGIIFYFKNSTLNIFMIELKSTMSEVNLNSCLEKFNQTIGKLSLYLCVNAWEHKEFEKFRDAKIKFNGLVFYTGRGNVPTKPTERIFSVFHSSNQNGKIICKTILGDDAIDVKFILRTNQEEIEISFEELVR